MKLVQFVYRSIFLNLDTNRDLICVPSEDIYLSASEGDGEFLNLDTELFDASDWDECFNILDTIILSSQIEVGDENEYFVCYPIACEEAIRDEIGLRRILGSNEELKNALLGVATYDNERAEEFRNKVIDFIENLDPN